MQLHPILFTAGVAQLARDGAGVLDKADIQQGSTRTGLEGGHVEFGTTASLTSQDNFIRFCSETSSFKGSLTNGQQRKGGSCSLFGDIPSVDNMVSTIITSPVTGTVLKENQSFDIKIQVTGLNTGSFTNPTATYYSAPQTLANGQIDGHTSITCQDVGDGTRPPDPRTFVFFKGLNAKAGNGGVLTATVTGGFKAGNFRCCTMSSARNHQPVLMPVVQRGAQDDCARYKVNADGVAPGGGVNINGTATGATSTDAVCNGGNPNQDQTHNVEANTVIRGATNTTSTNLVVATDEPVSAGGSGGRSATTTTNPAVATTTVDVLASKWLSLPSDKLVVGLHSLQPGPSTPSTDNIEADAIRRGRGKVRRSRFMSRNVL